MIDDHRVYTRIDAIEREWHQLAETTAASPFLWPGWIVAWVEAYGADELRIHTVWRDGRLVGVMPLVVTDARVGSPANWNSPRSGPVALDADAAAALARLVALDRAPRIDLKHVCTDDPATEWYAAALGSQGYLALPPRDRMSSPFATLADSWEGFETRLGKSRRKSLRRLDRRLAELGEVSVEVHTGGPGLEERLVEGFAVEGSGWKGREGTSINADPPLRTLLTSVARWAAENDMLRLLFIRLDGRPLAFDMMLVHHGVLHTLKGGYDEEYREYSPGVLAMRAIVTYATEQGVHTLEWLGDASDEYKLGWSDGTREIVSRSWLAPTLRGRTEHSARTALTWSKRRLGEALPPDAAARLRTTKAELSARFRRDST